MAERGGFEILRNRLFPRNDPYKPETMKGWVGDASVRPRSDLS